MGSDVLADMCIHSVGGGWGQETYDDKHSERVAIIRGTDIPKIASGDFSSIPTRFETPSKIKNRLLKKGDIVLEVSGGSAASGQHTGRPLLITSEILEKIGNSVIPASFCRLLRLDNSKVDPCYVMYLIKGMHLSGEIGNFENQSTGISNFQFTRFINSVYPAISNKELQQEAGSFLAELDNRITLLRETNKTLESIAQTIFKSWFVDFYPVRAKIEGSQSKGMHDETAALFPDGFEESELGLIPNGWEIGSIGNIAQVIKKKLTPTDLNAEMRYVGLEHVPRKSLSLTEWGDAEKLESSKAVFTKWDILFGKLRPYFHKVVLAPFDGVCSTDILVFRAKDYAYHGLLTMHLFSNELIDYADRLSNGAKMPRISDKDISAYAIAIPPKQVSSYYTKSVAPLFEQIMENIQRMRVLSELRDAMLPRLITGKF